MVVQCKVSTISLTCKHSFKQHIQPHIVHCIDPAFIKSKLNSEERIINSINMEDLMFTQTLLVLMAFLICYVKKLIRCNIFDIQKTTRRMTSASLTRVYAHHMSEGDRGRSEVSRFGWAVKMCTS